MNSTAKESGKVKMGSGLWRITSEAGYPLGVYAGGSVADALDALAVDAGYGSHADVIAVVGPFKGHVAYVGRVGCDVISTEQG